MHASASSHTVTHTSTNIHIWARTHTDALKHSHMATITYTPTFTHIRIAAHTHSKVPPPSPFMCAFRWATGMDFAAISIQIGNFMIASGRCTPPANCCAHPQHSFRTFNRATAPLNGLSNEWCACYFAYGSVGQQRLVQMADWTAAHTPTYIYSFHVNPNPKCNRRFCVYMRRAISSVANARRSAARLQFGWAIAELLYCFSILFAHFFFVRISSCSSFITILRGPARSVAFDAVF